MQSPSPIFPKAFIWRRLHSLLGLWIVLFLIEHLLTNSQAALLIGESGEGFIRAVNFIKHLPYLPVIEVVLLGVPIAFHGVFGIKYALEAKNNSLGGKKNQPRLTEYSRNHAYFWQRVTSWILLVGIIAHVGFMRFYMYPAAASVGDRSTYFVRIGFDSGLYTVAARLGVKLYDKSGVEKAKKELTRKIESLRELREKAHKAQKTVEVTQYDATSAKNLASFERLVFEEKRLKALTKRSLSDGQVIAEASDFGTATLLNVRDAFKHVFTAALYTIFVLAAVFHAFNGLWTFMISWGIVLRMRSQSRAVNWCVAIMVMIGFLGLASVWGTYFINLRY